MGITEFTLRIFLLFLPGVVTKLVIQKLTYFEKRDIFYFVIYSFVLGFFLYFISGGILYTINWVGQSKIQMNFLQALTDTQYKISMKEVTIVSFLAIPFGMLLSCVANKKYLHRLAQAIGVTKQFGEPDVWSYILNSESPTEWVIVRDIQNNLAYYGWVTAFSDIVKDSELFIRDVIVVNNTTGERLYTTPALYIARNRDNITIEFPGLEYIEPPTTEPEQNTKRQGG